MPQPLPNHPSCSTHRANLLPPRRRYATRLRKITKKDAQDFYVDRPYEE